MRKQIVILLVMAVAGNVVWAEDPVYFADTNLKTAVEEALSVTEPTPSDMLNLISLDARGKNISDLTGLEYALNLTYLDLSDNNINVVGPFENLINLVSLFLNYNIISDISPVGELINLTKLELFYNNLNNNISPLANLTQLTYLNIGSNNTTDISAISTLGNLAWLDLEKNGSLEDISTLTSLDQLEALYINENTISDISPLYQLPNLHKINAGRNNIADLSGIGAMVSLRELNLGVNQITDISSFVSLPNLIFLSLEKNYNLKDITELSNLTTIRNLNLGKTSIEDISALTGLMSLQMLWLDVVPLNSYSYCIIIPEIKSNNPGINIIYDPNPNSSAGDCNGDCRVNFGDFAVLASYWLEVNCAKCGGAEQTDDGNVLADDLAVVAENWLNRDFFKFDGNTLDNEPNWIIEGQWEFGQPSGLGGDSYGNPDPNSGFTGSNVFGVNLNGDYDASTPSGPYYLIAGPFNCTYLDNVNLKFARWLNTDESAYARSFVEASNNGTTWELVWEYNGRSALADNTWQTLEYDVSTVADGQETVYIRWGYEVLDYAYPYSGWNIDDVELWGNPNL